MPARAEVIFERLQSPADIEALIGTSEDADVECKVWPGKGEALKTIAKAACGFCNATGGVIVIGVETKRHASDQLDLIIGLKPVEDVHTVNSDALDVILKQVHPGIEGIRSKVILSNASGKAGFVLIFVPEAEGNPRWSAADRKFLCSHRIGNGIDGTFSSRGSVRTAATSTAHR